MNGFAFSKQNGFVGTLRKGSVEIKENNEDGTIVSLKNIHQEVLDFIEDFKETDEEVFELNMDREHWEGIYLRGNCYFFAEQLSKAFNNAKIWFNDCASHAVTEIEGLLFDVRGLVPYNWMEDYVEENPLLQLNGKCWSYDWRSECAGSELYFTTLSEAIKEPINNYIGYTEDENLEDSILEMMYDFIYDYITNSECTRTIAIENGWLDEDGEPPYMEGNCFYY